MELDIGNPSLPIQYSFEQIKLQVASNQLVFTVERPELSLMEKCKTVASKILNLLSHTPISGVGVNYGFTATSSDPDLYKIFDFSDNDHLSDAGLKIESNIIQRKLLLGEQVINLTLKMDKGKGKIVALFNFHKGTTKPQEAVAFLEGHTSEFENKAVQFLRDIYKANIQAQPTI